MCFFNRKLKKEIKELKAELARLKADHAELLDGTPEWNPRGKANTKDSNV